MQKLRRKGSHGRPRISYGLGDTAQNVVWGAMSILTFFYTDYAGVDPAIVGMVMLLSRCFDGVSDAIMGFIVEKTHSRWGKARPWILWMSVPFAISIVLMYMVPQGSSAVQFAYIFVTYNFCTTICYTAMNLPYGALSTMMTPLSKERDMLSVTRMALSPLGKILSVSATLPLIKLFGDTQTAWIEVMSIWGVVAIGHLTSAECHRHDRHALRVRTTRDLGDRHPHPVRLQTRQTLSDNYV